MSIRRVGGDFLSRWRRVVLVTTPSSASAARDIAAATATHCRRHRKASARRSTQAERLKTSAMDFLEKLAEVEGEMVTTSGEAAAGGGTSSLAAPSWLARAASSVARGQKDWQRCRIRGARRPRGTRAQGRGAACRTGAGARAAGAQVYDLQQKLKQRQQQQTPKVQPRHRRRRRRSRAPRTARWRRSSSRRPSAPINSSARRAWKERCEGSEGDGRVEGEGDECGGQGGEIEAAAPKAQGGEDGDGGEAQGGRGAVTAAASSSSPQPAATDSPTAAADAEMARRLEAAEAATAGVRRARR